jgi:hypothetical protein
VAALCRFTRDYLMCFVHGKNLTARIPAIVNTAAPTIIQIIEAVVIICPVFAHRFTGMNAPMLFIHV